TASYPPDHPVFHGPGQAGDVRLTPNERTNLCKEINLTLTALTPPALGPVTPGSVTGFEMPSEPAVGAGPLPHPAGVIGIATVINLGGRPAQLQFIAPAGVPAGGVDIPFDLIFGSDPTPANRRTIHVVVHVDP